MSKLMPFVHLHCHSDYSLYDGFQRVPDMVNHAHSRGFQGIALTDHGKVGGFIKLYKNAKSKNIKPMFGCEFYLVDEIGVTRPQRYHLTVLAKNKAGYRNILRLCSISHQNTYRNFPLLDYKTLYEHSEGLIVLSGCVVGKFASLILEENIEGADNLLGEMKDVFGNDLYVEVMWTGYEPQKLVLKHGINLAKKYDLTIIGSNDVHYSRKIDGEGQRLKVSISRNGPLKPYEYTDHQMYMKNLDEMKKAFGEVLKDGSGDQYLLNTMEVFDKCDNIEIDLGKAKLPAFEIPEDDEDFNNFKKNLWNIPESEAYLTYLSEKGLKAKNLWDKAGYRERLYKEIETIKFTGFDTYFLIVQDYCEFARSRNIRIGTGRGSGVGSLVLYCLGVTGLDPIKYDLSMDRFLFAAADYHVSCEDFFSFDNSEAKEMDKSIEENIQIVEDDPKTGVEEKCSC